MIHTQREYEVTRRCIAENRLLVEQQRTTFVQEGLTADRISRLLDPILAFHEQLEAEVAAYERAQAGQIDPACTLADIGHLLIQYRIAHRLNQTELARLLEVDASTVSRDDNNEYWGATLERVQRILDALGEDVVIVPTAQWQSLLERSTTHSPAPNERALGS